MPATISDPDVILSGFHDIRDEATNPNGKLIWYCAPDSWPVQLDQREGRDGSWRLVRQNQQHVSKSSSSSDDDDDVLLEIKPPAKKDFWRKTYYTPLLIKDDGPVLYCTLSTTHRSDTTSSPNGSPSLNNDSPYYTVTTCFTLTAYSQFDQAGLYLRLDAEHWIKAGIEVVDGIPRLSTVVCNIYSDWATQEWPSTSQLPQQQPEQPTSAMAETSCDDDDDENVGGVLAAGGIQTSARVRVHCRGTSFVVEAEFPDKGWQFVRVAHMSTAMQQQCDNNPPPPSHNETTASPSSLWQGPDPEPGTMWVGVFACCPEDQRGGKALFSEFTITKGSHLEHNANGNSELTSIASF